MNLLQHVRTDVVVKLEDALNANDPRLLRGSRDQMPLVAYNSAKAQFVVSIRFPVESKKDDEFSAEWFNNQLL